MKNKPNILILYSDQHNARTLGCYGNSEVYTPNLDRLAAEGIRFKRAYTQNPICTPSRMSFMSGQYVHNFGYFGLMGRCPEHLPTLLGHFRKFGYLTGMAGKTHTPTGWLSKDCDFLADGYGFEMHERNYNSHMVEGLQGIRNNEFTLHLYEKGEGHNRDDKILQEWFEKHGHTNGQGLDARYSRLSEDDSIEAWSADKTNQFIKASVKAQKPFCLWMAVPRPHQTYAPAKKFWDMYDEDKLTLPPNAENTMEGRHPCAKQMQRHYQQDTNWRIFEPKDWESTRRRVLKGYYANVTQVDDAAGRVLDYLDELGIREDTIVVYMTDHGEFAGEHGMIEKAPGIGFKCVTQIPLIISWKGKLAENEVRENLVESLDLFPTLCELAGVEQPDWVDGNSLMPMLNKDCEIKDIAVTENALTKTIHTKKYKFTQYIPEMNDGKDFGELYDLEKDPWELENLYFKPEYQDVVQKLRYKLYCWLVRSTRHVTVNPQPVFDNQEFSKGWDQAEELYAEDGKLKKEFVEYLLNKKFLNYL